MRAIACAIVIAALIRDKRHYACDLTDIQLISMSVLMGYFLFWG